VEANAATDGEYINLGQVTFDGAELEGKYYFHKNFFVMGSALYQRNEDGEGNKNVTPIPNYSAKGGISYEATNGFSLGMFDVYSGPLHGYSGALNPLPVANHLLNGNLRLDLSKFLHSPAWAGIAFVAHAENLLNTPIWIPDWKDVPGDTIFSNQGRTVYAGLEFPLGQTERH
jgi:outer membrane receptor protein involved in Fe transport